MSSDLNPDRRDSSGGDPFATTHWSLVVAAGERGSAESARALETLCRAYWPTLYAYARRRVGDVHAAQDLTQGFFARLLEKQYLRDADPARGRFRAFLITAFKHYLAKEWNQARAQKRGGGVAPFPLDFAWHDSHSGGPATDITAEQLYERQWAITLLDRVMRRLQREMERAGKARQFQALKDMIGGSRDTDYESVAAELGTSEPAARMAASRLRARYRELLRDEISQTVSTPAEIDDEVRHLFAVFAE